MPSGCYIVIFEHRDTEKMRKKESYDGDAEVRFP